MDDLLPAPPSSTPPLPTPYYPIFDHVVFIPGGFETLAGIERVDRNGPQSSWSFAAVSILPPRERASFLQAWLFFALLAEFFGQHIPKESILRLDVQTESRTIVAADKAAISAMRDEWHERLSASSPEARIERVNKAITLLNFATSQCDRFDESHGDHEDLLRGVDQQVLASVVLSIRLLIAYLRSTIDVFPRRLPKSSLMARLFESPGPFDVKAKNHSIPPIPPGGTVTSLAWILLERFMVNGWCPIRARQICRLYDFSVVNYLSQLQRVDPPGINHQKCKAALKL